jgi:hypothetical protein
MSATTLCPTHLLLLGRERDDDTPRRDDGERDAAAGVWELALPGAYYTLGDEQRPQLGYVFEMAE